MGIHGEAMLPNQNATMSLNSNGSLQFNLTQWQRDQLQGLTPMGIQCLIDSWISLANNPIQEPYCNVTWDQIYCWPATLAGETVKRPCSEVMKDDEEVDAQNIIGDAYRVCSLNATWLWDNWTNYNDCITGMEDNLRGGQNDDATAIAIKDAVRYILFVGSILSLLCLCVALFIFYYFKSIRCDRITVQVHLMLALALRSLLLIVISEPYVFNRTSYHYRSVDWVCKVVLALQFYATVASVNWMFVQGHYLHSRLTTNVFDYGLPLGIYCSLGWGLPLVLVSVWSCTMEIYHSVPCWKNYGVLHLNWIIVGPMLLVLSANLIFLANIMRILLTKIQLTSAATDSEQFRRAVKATAFLFPLLGFNFLLFCYNPGGTIELYYMLTNSILQTSQGVFVSLLYCFICKDVKDAIRRQYGRFSARRSANSMRGQSTRRTSFGGMSIREKLMKRSPRANEMSASYTRPQNKMVSSSIKSERTTLYLDGAEASIIESAETANFLQPNGENCKNSNTPSPSKKHCTFISRPTFNEDGRDLKPGLYVKHNGKPLNSRLDDSKAEQLTKNEESDSCDQDIRHPSEIKDGVRISVCETRDDLKTECANNKEKPAIFLPVLETEIL